MGYIQFLGNSHYLQSRMKKRTLLHISHYDKWLITCTCQFAKIDTFEKLFLNPEKVFSSRLISSSRNSFKIVTRIVRTRSRSYLICPAAVYTPDNVADKHWPIELAFLSVVISIHNFSLIGWKVGMVVTKSRDNGYIM